jgi:type III secretory pathway component EscS
MHSENSHRGITMHQLPVAGNIPGLIFAVGSALIFLFAIPALWYVLVAAVAVGLVIAALLQALHQERPDETARLTLKI